MSGKTIDWIASWEPIETAPRDGTRILLFFPDRKISIQGGYWREFKTYTNGTLDYESKSWTSDIHGLLLGPESEKQPTHWMRMPSVPFDITKTQTVEFDGGGSK